MLWSTLGILHRDIKLKVSKGLKLGVVVIDENYS